MAGQPITVYTIQALLEVSESSSASEVTINDIALYFQHGNPVETGDSHSFGRAVDTCSPLPSGWIFDHKSS